MWKNNQSCLMLFRSFLRIFEVNHEDTFIGLQAALLGEPKGSFVATDASLRRRCEKYRSKLCFSRSFIRIFANRIM